MGFGITQFLSFQQSKPIQNFSVTTSISPAPTLNQEKETAVVRRVIDGDTVELADGRKLRYIGIDTPEVVDPRKPLECFGKEAQAFNRELVEGKEIFLEKDVSEVDRYDRLLRYVYINNLMVNDYLIRQGFAHASTFPPDVKYAEQFVEAEREARTAGRGLWNGCKESQTPVLPSAIPTNLSNSSNLTNSEQNSTCIIKGNISTNGEKIYHLPVCGSYNKTAIDESKGERSFCTEVEAQTAGWRKAKNCPQ